jgi:hypothetical protein
MAVGALWLLGPTLLTNLLTNVCEPSSDMWLITDHRVWVPTTGCQIRRCWRLPGLLMCLMSSGSRTWR